MRGPIKEKATGRTYALDDAEDDATIDIDNVATRAPDSDMDDTATDDAATDDALTDTDADAAPAQDDETDDQK